MKIGDTVRLIHGKEQGKIVSIIDAKQVEVEIEDGFRIPVSKMELVVVASEETSVFSDNIESETTVIEKWNGVYLAFVRFNDQIFELHLINDTGYKTHFVIGEEYNEKYKGVFSGNLEAESSIKIMEVSLKDFDNWPEYVIQLLFFRYGESIYRLPLIKKVKFRSATFFKSEKKAPILNKSAHLFRLDMDAIKVDAKLMEAGMLENKQAPVIEISKPSEEIDLHIEKLTESFQGMSNNAILTLQLETFNRNLENAIATKMSQIIFIHGLGNGVLKKEIHKSLSGNKNIAFFQDAQKERFGYGATLVKLK
jgi:dsDNA-specific endonuclease/ATPase MutS2